LHSTSKKGKQKVISKDSPKPIFLEQMFQKLKLSVVNQKEREGNLIGIESSF
jgi:hypothetical protein